jgi:hypothetical protein
LNRALLAGGVALLILFFVPWVIRPTRILYTWNLLRGGSIGRVVFLIWIPIAAVNLLALRFLPIGTRTLRAALTLAIGIIPLIALCATSLTFGQPPAAFPDTVGYGLLAAAPLIAFGLQHHVAFRGSKVARVTVVGGVGLILASLVVPHATDEGVSAPIVYLFDHASRSAPWMGLAIYLVLPVPLALGSLLVFSHGARFDKPLRVFQFYFLRFVPGLFLLLAFPAFVAEKGGVYRPYILFVGMTITAYLGCVVSGVSALLAEANLRRARRASTALRQT